MAEARMGEGAKVLLVEDEPQMRRFLRAALESHGYRALEALTAQEGVMLATSHRPDVILLDLGLPDMDGLDLARRIREWSQTPVIVISARGQEGDKILALDAGADDYLTKPFGTGELMARIRAALRRTAQPQTPEAPVFHCGRWSMDFSKREVTVDSQAIHLTPLEYKLLATLVRHAGKVLTHQLLLKEVWEGQPGAQPHYLRVYMAQLRQKLEADSARPKHLITEPGVGYRLHVERD